MLPAGNLERMIIEEAAKPVTFKPKLRGWLHAVMFPVAVVAGIVLLALAGTTEARIGSAVFAISAALLFARDSHPMGWDRRAKTGRLLSPGCRESSAIHRGGWSGQ